MQLRTRRTHRKALIGAIASALLITATTSHADQYEEVLPSADSLWKLVISLGKNSYVCKPIYEAILELPVKPDELPDNDARHGLPDVCDLNFDDPRFRLKQPTWTNALPDQHPDEIHDFFLQSTDLLGDLAWELAGNEQDPQRVKLWREYAKAHQDALNAELWRRYGDRVMALLRQEPNRFQESYVDMTGDKSPEHLYRIALMTSPEPPRFGRPVDGRLEMRSCSWRSKKPAYSIYASRAENESVWHVLQYYSDNDTVLASRGEQMILIVSHAGDGMHVDRYAPLSTSISPECSVDVDQR